MKKGKWNFLLTISCIISVLLLYNIISYYCDYKKDLELKEKIKEYDLGKLREVNSDIVGFIEVDNTKVRYPVVKSNDNKFYLNHSYKKKKN